LDRNIVTQETGQVLLRKSFLVEMLILSMAAADSALEKLNERKKHYPILDDDTIQSLIRYYKLDDDNPSHNKQVLKFVKDAVMKGDTLA
jgi:hypothetical protein